MTDLEIADWDACRLACRHAHAAGLNHGHEDVQIIELEAASNPVAPAHGGTPLGFLIWADRTIAALPCYV